jgi:hypothetical protein
MKRPLYSFSFITLPFTRLGITLPYGVWSALHAVQGFGIGVLAVLFVPPAIASWIAAAAAGGLAVLIERWDAKFTGPFSLDQSGDLLERAFAVPFWLSLAQGWPEGLPWLAMWVPWAFAWAAYRNVKRVRDEAAGVPFG